MADDFWEMRCRVCGTLTGYHRMAKPMLTWCTPQCEAMPYSKYPEQIERDEVACELYLAGMPVSALSKELDISRQLSEHVLQQRGVFSPGRVKLIA